MSITIGVDSHLDTLAVSVIDRLGREQQSLVVPNSRPGWERAWALGRQQPTTWAVEGSGSYGRAFSAFLVSQGADVREVPTRLSVRERHREGPAKSDPKDARAAARAALREELPRVLRSPQTEALRVVLEHRASLVQLQTAALNRLRARLGEVDPARVARLERLRTLRRLRALEDCSYRGDPHREVVSELVSWEARRAQERLQMIRRLHRDLADLLPRAGYAIVEEIFGIAVLGAARLLGEVGDVRRFPSHRHFASWNGTGPLDVSSGRQRRHRFNPGGNRHVNRVLHTAIITQLRHGRDAQSYVERRMTEGKTKAEAIRAAKNFLSRKVYRILRHHPVPDERFFD